jgi:hypothetical protein
MGWGDFLLPTKFPPRVRPQSFGQYLKRPPLLHLLGVIALAIAIRLALAALLLTLAPGWPLWLNYIVSVIPALAVALLAAYALYRRSA